MIFFPALRTHFRRRMSQYRFRRWQARQEHHRIVLGAAGIVQDGWTLTDIEILDIRNRGDWGACFAKGSIDALVAEHVWEHLSRQEGFCAARHCFDYLRNGGYLRVAVPDGLFPESTYLEKVKPGGTDLVAGHKVLFNYKSLSALFESVGFRVCLLEYFDEMGKFHQKSWDPKDGLIRRCKNFDERNQAGSLVYTSIILDAVKIRCEM